MFKRRILTFALFGALATLSATAGAEEIRSTLQDQQQVAVTIYNDNLALVKDQRKINLARRV